MVDNPRRRSPSDERCLCCSPKGESVFLSCPLVIKWASAKETDYGDDKEDWDYW